MGDVDDISLALLMACSAAAASACALLSRSLDSLSGTRLNTYLRKKGKATLSNGSLDELDKSGALLAVGGQVLPLVLVALAVVFVSRGTLSVGWSVTFFAAVALFLILFVGLIPDTVARAAPEKVVSWALPLIRLFGRVFGPFVEAYEAVTRFLVRAAGGDIEKHAEQAVEEEILSAAEEGEREGVIEQGGKDMIESIISFYDAEVKEVMTPRTSMVCIAAETNLPEAVQSASGCGHSRIPVFRENRDSIIGILYVKDLLRYLEGTAWSEKNVGQIARKAYFVPESKKVSQLFQEFRSQRFHIAVVLDEYGGTSGLVTIEDILEEIVGEIADEYEQQRAEARVRQVDERTNEVDAVIHIDELNESLGLEIPEDDSYETLAGFLFSQWGRIPLVGERLAYRGMDFEVVEADERRIKSVRIRVGEPG